MPLSEAEKAYKREYRLRRIAADPSYSATLAAAALRYKRRKQAADPEAWRAKQRARDQERKNRPGDKERRLSHDLKKLYGITLSDKRAMFDRQGGRCVLCSAEFASLSHAQVDHDHETGAVRELLCALCNMALGSAKDNPDRLRAMADYIDKHRKQGQPNQTVGD